MRSRLVQVPLGRVLKGAAQQLNARIGGSRVVDSRDFLIALADSDVDGQWDRIQLQTGGHGRIRDLRRGDDAPEPAGEWQGLRLSASLEQCIRAAVDAAASRGMDAVPPAFLALAIAADRTTAGAKALLHSGISHARLLMVMQEALLGYEDDSLLEQFHAAATSARDRRHAARGESSSPVVPAGHDEPVASRATAPRPAPGARAPGAEADEPRHREPAVLPPDPVLVRTEAVVLGVVSSVISVALGNPIADLARVVGRTLSRSDPSSLFLAQAWITVVGALGGLAAVVAAGRRLPPGRLRVSELVFREAPMWTLVATAVVGLFFRERLPDALDQYFYGHLAFWQSSFWTVDHLELGFQMLVPFFLGHVVVCLALFPVLRSVQQARERRRR